MTSDSAGMTFRRMSTGSAALDRILGGGLPAGSVVVVAGGPGTGKTVVTLQTLFHQARQGRKCLYFTTLSEPSIKLIRYMQLFPFFDLDLLNERFVFVDLGTAVREQGPEQALNAIVERVEAEQPDFVAIDSFKAIHDLLGGPASSRAFVYDLAVQMAGWGATTLLVGEYGAQEIATEPEFAIADGIIRLSNATLELTAVRELEVLKLRGANPVTGRHFFDITADGVEVYPRVRAPDVDADRAVSYDERLATGVAGLDDLLRGGLPRLSATIVEGGTGTGKTLVALSFLVEGARRGERGLLFALEETPRQLRAIAANFGWDLADLEARGLLAIEYASPVELSTDRFLDRARQRMLAERVSRAALDSLTSLSLGVPSQRRYRELVYALVKHARADGVSLLMTMEVPELLGTTQLTGHGISSIADNVILIRYVELSARLARAISVLKARGVDHRTELRQLMIGRGGASVGPPFGALRGVLTGLPVEVPGGLQAGQGGPGP